MDAIKINLTYKLFYSVFIIEVIISKLFSKWQLIIPPGKGKIAFTYNAFYSVKYKVIGTLQKVRMLIIQRFR